MYKFPFDTLIFADFPADLAAKEAGEAGLAAPAFSSFFSSVILFLPIFLCFFRFLSSTAHRDADISSQCSGIGFCPLASGRQSLAMSSSSVSFYLLQSLDVGRYFPAQISFNFMLPH